MPLRRRRRRRSRATGAGASTSRGGCSRAIGAGGCPTRGSRLGRRSHGGNEITGRDRAALGDVDLVNDPTGSRWHIHRGLFGLERHEGCLGLDALTGFHQDVDDSDVFEVAHVGHSYFYEAHSRVHRNLSLQTFQGTGLEESMPSVFIAPVSVAWSTLPSSAKAFRAATAI